MLAKSPKKAVPRVRSKPKGFKIPLMARLRAAQKQQRPQSSFFEPDWSKLHPPGVGPGHNSMAMDEDMSLTLGWAQNNIQSVFSEGLTFLGYAFLAQLAQRPEYRRAAEIIATEMTRKWIKLQAVGDVDKTDEIKQLTDELDRLQVRNRFRKLAEIDGYFGRAHLYLDFGTTDDADELKTPIGNGRDDTSRLKIKKGSLQRLKVVEPVWCYPTNYDSINPLRTDWYEPDMWYVMATQIHATRLLKFVGREVPDLLKPAYSFGGLSLSQMGKPYVDNWLRTRQSVADLIHAFSVFVLHSNLSTSLQEGGEEFFERLEMFINLRDNRNVMVVDKDTEDLTNVSAPLGSLDALQAQTQEHLCVSKGTLIETQRGQIPIEKLSVRDMVLTRNGFAPIKWVGVTGRASRFVEIEISNSVLRITECHPVWEDSLKQFVSAQNVSSSHLLLKSRGWESTVGRFHGEAIYGAKQNSATTEASAVGEQVKIDGLRVIGVQDEQVYNISVADGFLPEFFANGILVHNCAVWGIPTIKYLNIQPAGFNASSEGEIRTFYDSINAFQEVLFRSNLTKVIDFIQLSLWGEVDPDITFAFEPLWSLDEAALAGKRKTEADTDQVLMDIGAVSQEEVRKRVASDPTSPYASIDVNELPTPPNEEGGMEELDAGEMEPDALETPEDETGGGPAPIDEESGLSPAEDVVEDRIGQLSSAEMTRFKKMSSANQAKIIQLLEQVRRYERSDPEKARIAQQKLDEFERTLPAMDSKWKRK